MTKYIKTKFTPDNWASERDLFVGCSEVASLMGLNKDDGVYKSAWALYMEKIGEPVPRFTGNPLTREGQRAEADILEMAQYYDVTITPQFANEAMWANYDGNRKLRRIRKSNYYYSCPSKCLFLRGSIDGFFREGRTVVGVEAKNTSSMVLRNYAERISPAHYIQMQAYLIVTGWEKWWLCQKVDGNRREVYVAYPDADVQKAIIKSVNDFMERVIAALRIKKEYGIAEYSQKPLSHFTEKQQQGIAKLQALEPDFSGAADELTAIRALRKDRLETVEIPGTDEMLLLLSKYGHLDDQIEALKADQNAAWNQFVNKLQGADVAKWFINNKEMVAYYKADSAGRMKKYVTPDLMRHAQERFKQEQK